MMRMVLVAAMMLGISGAAKAEVFVTNKSGKSVWLTLYDAFGKSVSARCLSNNVQLHYKPSGAMTITGKEGSIIYIRGELKENTDCGGKTLSDTGRGSPLSVPSNGLVRTFTMVGGSLRI